MKQILLSFRIFDFVSKKYLTPDSKVYIGLDGKVVTPEGTDEADRYEVAHSLPIYDINGKQLFTDDGFVTILEGEVVHAYPKFDTETNAWIGVASKGIFSIKSKEFQILPNGEEVNAGIIGTDIQAAWDKKASEIPAPEANASNTPPEGPHQDFFTRSRSYGFANLDVCVYLRSQTDRTEEQWDKIFDDVLGSEIFHCKPAAEPDTQDQGKVAAEPAVLGYTALNLSKQGSEPAPKDWWTIPEIQAAKPKQNNCEKSLQLVDGTTNIVAWEIGRGGSWAVASDFYLIEPVKPEVADESSSS